MVFHTAHLRVHASVVQSFKERIERHCRTSLAEESGCSRFDFYQEDNDASLFLLIECYRDEAALHAHRASAHYLAFRADVTDWVTERHWWYWNTGLREREAVLVRQGFP